MKRQNNLFKKIISDQNIEMAINEVNRTHRWHHYPDKPNKTVLRVSQNKQYYINEIKNIIINGFKPSETVVKHRYDRNAKKWRDIAEPKLYPDQYVHHALIQVLKPIMMRGMDKCVCGSIPNRGIHYGKHFIEKWVRNDIKGTKWCLQMDIKHFYPSIQPKYVMARFKSLIKDYKTLDLVERTLKDGVLIGAYYSQWYANTLLQPLDRLIRNIGNKYGITFYDISQTGLKGDDQTFLKNVANIDGTPTTVFIEDGEEKATTNRLVGNVPEYRVIERLKAMGYIDE